MTGQPFQGAPRDIAVPGPAVPSAGGQRSSQAWLVTFTDLVALLLTFFVMLFAMSKVEQRKWQNLTDALAQDLNAVREVPTALASEQLGIEGVRVLAGTDLDYLAALLNQNMAADPRLQQGVLGRLDDRLVIALPGDLLFASGSSSLAETGREAVAALGSLLRRLDNRIEVAGHADPRRPVGGYASNWDLSLTRALRVAEVLSQAGYRGPIQASGFGDSRFAALSRALAPARRLELARRVELIVHAHAEELP